MAERVPAYAMAPIKAFLKYLQSTTQLLNVSVRGITMLIGMPALVERIALPLRATLPDEWNEEEYQASLTKARETAGFAEAES